MKDLIIVRHGVAFERDARRWPDDRLRPLTTAGKRKFRGVACGLASWMDAPDCLLTSPLVRARQTARLLTKVGQWPEAAEWEELAPDVDPKVLLARLRRVPGERVALVGHEPQLSALIDLCVSRTHPALRIEMKKGGAALITFEASLRPGAGQLTALIPPAALRRLK
jgi:phosphohistidine phosphatase